MLEKFKNLKEIDIKILKAAKEEFLKNGFHRANIDNIARNLRIGKGTIYRHFGNKHILFLSLLVHNLLEKWDSVKKSIEGKDFKTTFEKLIENFISFHIETSRIFSNLFSEEIWKEFQKQLKKDKKLNELMSFIVNCREESIELIKNSLDMAKKENIISTEINSRILAEIILITINHFFITFYVNPPVKQKKQKEYSIEEGIKELKAFIYRGVGYKEN